MSRTGIAAALPTAYSNRRLAGVFIGPRVRLAESVDIHHCLGKGLRGFLRQIVPYTAG